MIILFLLTFYFPYLVLFISVYKSLIFNNLTYTSIRISKINNLKVNLNEFIIFFSKKKTNNLPYI